MIESRPPMRTFGQPSALTPGFPRVVLRAAGLALLVAAASCGEDDGRYPPPGQWMYPPTPESAGGGGGGGGGGDTGSFDTGTAADSDTGTATDTSTTADTGTDTGAPIRDLLAGSFVLEDGVEYELPIVCALRFYAPGLIEPSTGIDVGAFTEQKSFPVEAWPSAFALTVDDSRDVILPGDVGYVTAVCDVDGDALLNDGVGGYWRTLPLEEVTIPATGLELVIGPLP